MKTIISINGGNVGSTGRIMRGISSIAKTKGYATYQAYPKSRNLLPIEKNDYIICSVPVKFLNTRLAYITGLNGYFAAISTFFFLRKVDKIKPDIIHFHNLHDSYINLKMLFNYVKKNKIRVVWTLHDCWSFTGGCAHFTYASCSKWRTGCGRCSQLDTYPAQLIDTTKWLWKKKKEWFVGVDDLTIVTPSAWLAGLVKDSFLGCYPIKVINNGIDLNIFRPTPSDFRKRYNISADDTVLLGVAYNWGEKKGLDVFVEMSKRLSSRFKIVLVGTNEAIEEHIPQEIICIRKTNSQTELAEIYTSADLFVNPTREDNFPTVNIEALACGTPVITFDTGGCSEMIDKSCGSIISCGDIVALEREIIRIAETNPFLSEDCIRKGQTYSSEERYKDYVDLYNRIE